MLSNDMFTIWIMTIMTIPILDHDNMILNIVPKNWVPYHLVFGGALKPLDISDDDGDDEVHLETISIIDR